MKVRWETLVGAVIIAGSILFVERYTISAASNGETDSEVYRLDRWTGTLCRPAFDCGVQRPPKSH